VIANFEVANWLGNQGVANTVGMNHGGNFKTEFGSVKMVPALHSSSMPDGSYGGTAAGFVIQIDQTKIWVAGDTALFSDMDLIGELGIDIAIVPIGDLYTMGLADSVEAILLANPKTVFPSHYNTWPPIEQDGDRWSNMVSARTSAKPVVLEPGGIHEFESK
jgi:L-ascorbate metabolism protein UlaG (beta-lactamase superfamily)